MYAVVVASAVWAAYQFVSYLCGKKLDPLLRLAASVPLGILYQSLFVFVLQMYLDWGKVLAFTTLAFFGGVGAVFYFLNRRRNNGLVILMNLIDATALGMGILWCLFRLSRVYFEDGQYTRGACYSDFNFHLQLISSLSEGPNRHRRSLFDFTTPFFAKTTLAYPVLVNFHAAFLYTSCDASLPNSMRASVFPVVAANLVLIHRLALLFTKSSVAAALAIPLWLFAGGIGFLNMDSTLFTKIYEKNLIHSIGPHLNAFWFQTVSHVFHPQRCATFAIPMCVIVMIFLFYGVQSFEMKYFIVAAVAVGVLPQTQVHSYVAIAIFAISLAVIQLFASKKPIKMQVQCWTCFGILANVIALPLCYPFFGRVESSDGFMKFKPIWEDSSYTSSSFPVFGVFWRALGVIAAIGLGLGFFVASKEQISFYSASLPVVLVASTIMFQPWELDNTKILHDGWLPLAVGFVAQYFVVLGKRCRSLVFLMILVVLYLSCIASGFLNTLIYEGYPAPLYLESYQNLGRWMSENTPPDAIIHNPAFINPASSVAGRISYYGYEGWISSHGLSIYGRNSNNTRMKSATHPQIFIENDIKYIVSTLSDNGPKNLDEYPGFEAVYKSRDFIVYKILNIEPQKPAQKPKTVKKRVFRSLSG